MVNALYSLLEANVTNRTRFCEVKEEAPPQLGPLPACAAGGQDIMRILQCAARMGFLGGTTVRPLTSALGWTRFSSVQRHVDCRLLATQDSVEPPAKRKRRAVLSPEAPARRMRTHMTLYLSSEGLTKASSPVPAALGRVFSLAKRKRRAV